MCNKLSIYTILLGISLTLTGTASEKIEWKPEDAWRKNKKSKTSKYITHAEFHEKHKEYKSAIKFYKKIEKHSVNLNNKAKAIIAHGRCFEKMGREWNAYIQYKKAVDEYSNYIPFIEILNKEFSIANKYAKGKRDKFLFFSFSAYGKAIKIYDHITQAGPYAPITPEALYRSGLLSLKIKDYKEAAANFSEIISRYPGSKFVADARIDIADTLLRNAAEADGDGSLVRQAHKQLTLFFSLNKNHPRNEEAQKLLDLALTDKAKNLLYLGQFYSRPSHKRIPASKRYLRQVISDYQETDSARLAEKLLTIIETE